MKKLTTDEWISKAIKVHGNKYDYSKVEYKGSKQKVCIICPEHGEFWQIAADHINKSSDCPECAHIKTIKLQVSNTSDFIQKAKKIHGSKYDYSKVQYINAKTKVCIICPEHGEFWQTPNNHLNGQKCPKCAIESNSDIHRYTLNQFIEKANSIHNNKYDYSKTNYINSQSYITIICPKHGEFQQLANNHLQGCDCPKCAIELSSQKRMKSTDQFIAECSKVHYNKYDYSKCYYTGIFNKVNIICPKHGIFQQRACAHLQGQGCPKCNQSKGEIFIELFLIKKDIKYIQQFEITIDTQINPSGFAYIDFYLPDYDLYIEYNGIQHYKYLPYFHKGGNIDFQHQLNRDNYIRCYLKNKLLEFSYIQTDEEIIKILNERLS